ncbi:MAG: isoprenoid biosynthesis glyoxalase ElbB [Bacteroidales bacterium]|jgi:enhancing lycopene biosynthesis protein 2
MKKFAVILSGCGVNDGAEIHEAVLTLYAISSLGAEYKCFAPDIKLDTVNHALGKPDGSQRSVLEESARISRGDIEPLSKFNQKDFDAIVLPGGFGAAKNLCTYAIDGINHTVNDEVKQALVDMYEAGKPIGAMCIAPVLIAKVFPGSILTIGSDENTANDIEQMGCEHSLTNRGEVCIDLDNNIYTTACYMQDENIAEIGVSTKNLIEAMLEHM